VKIGITTFQWGTNYGAVLQAFALQQYLERCGYEVEIINYVPFKVKALQMLSLIKNHKPAELLKEYRLNKFRKKYLKMSKGIYHNSASLKSNCHKYDSYICGSDQIWNEWFVLSSEANPNLSCYLDFAKTDKARISYATSFGTDKLSDKVVNLIKPELQKFKKISVRENTGKAIVENMGLHAALAADPTLLLKRESYERLMENKRIKERYQLFSYILHENQVTAKAANDYVFRKYFRAGIDKKYNGEPIGILEWLYNVKNAKFVVTNSFHGAIFSIIFHTPFVVVPVENSGMNDRIATLLNAVDLTGRMIETFDEATIDIAINQPINWDQVDERVCFLRDIAHDFLKNALSK